MGLGGNIVPGCAACSLARWVSELEGAPRLSVFFLPFYTVGDRASGGRTARNNSGGGRRRRQKNNGRSVLEI